MDVQLLTRDPMQWVSDCLFNVYYSSLQTLSCNHPSFQHISKSTECSEGISFFFFFNECETHIYEMNLTLTRLTVQYSVFVCLDHSSSERCTMGRLDGKVIVLSAAAQGIGRAAAIVMSLIRASRWYTSHQNIDGNCVFIHLCCADEAEYMFFFSLLHISVWLWVMQTVVETPWYFV